MISLTKFDTLCKKNYSRVRRRERKKLLLLFVRCVVAIKKSFRRRSSATIFHLPLDGNKVSQALPKL